MLPMKTRLTTDKLQGVVVNLLTRVIAVLVIGAVIGCASKQGREAEGIETVTIHLQSIVCSVCVETVKEAVTDVEGVQGVTVSLDEKVATVRYLPTTTDLSTIEEAIAEAGYDANERKANAEAYENLPSCCKKHG